MLIPFFFIALIVSPATTPATTNSVFDLSTPQLAVQSMHDAIERDDAKAMSSILYAADDSQRHLNDAYGGLILSTHRLASAIAEKFGDTGDMLAMTAASMPDVKSTDSPEQVETQVKTSDRTITMKLRGRARPMTFQRDDAGRWHIDLLSFADASTDDLPAQLAMINDLAKSIRELADDVHGNRFRTIGDVKAAIQDRVHSAIARSLRHDRPATQPATNSTTHPS